VILPLVLPNIPDSVDLFLLDILYSVEIMGREHRNYLNLCITTFTIGLLTSAGKEVIAISGGNSP
jgi:hypothetical protein